MSTGVSADVIWSAAQLPQALGRLAATLGRSGPRVGGNAAPAPPEIADTARFERWLRGHGQRSGVVVVPHTLAVVGLEDQLASCGPALLRIGPATRGTFVAVRRSTRRGDIELVGPRGESQRLPAAQLAASLREQAELPDTAWFDALFRVLGEAGSPRADERRRAARMLADHSEFAIQDRCWTLDVDDRAGLRPDLRGRWYGTVLALLATYAAQRGLWIVAYALLASCVAAGPGAGGWLAAWVVALACTLPLDALMGRLFGGLALSLGASIKQYVFLRITALDPEGARRRSAGEVLARVQESQEIETLALASGLAGATALIDVAIVVGVFVHVGSLLHVQLFLGFVLAVCIAFSSLRRRASAWSEHRLSMTETMVEDVLHHRTRAVQLGADKAQDREDEQMAVHHRLARRMDDVRSLIIGAGARTWLVVSVLAMIPAVALDPSALRLTLLLGGVVFAHRVLDRLANSGVDIVDTLIAVAKLRALVRSPRAHELAGDPDLAARLPFGDDRLVSRHRPLLELQDVGFRHGDTGFQVLEGCNLRIDHGDRVLLEGRSGGGKSTLVSLLGAVRSPKQGSVRLHGLDLETVGTEAWRDSVVCVPQFQLNHVFSGSMAFNLLIGRRWPPTDRDLADAAQLCEELGLGPLLRNMPAGLAQPVGDAGWQLSHGERIRVFLARALLQGGDVFVLDESLSALDPETQLQVLACIQARARTVVLSAHT